MGAATIVAMEVDHDELQLVQAVFPGATEAMGLLDPVLERADLCVFGGSIAHARGLVEELPWLRCIWLCAPQDVVEPGGEHGPHGVVPRPVLPDDLERAARASGVDVGRPEPEPEPQVELAPGTGILFFDDDDADAVDPAPAPEPPPGESRDADLDEHRARYGDPTGWSYPLTPPDEEVLLAELTSTLGSLPTLPRTYQALCKELLDPRSSMHSVAAIIEQAPAVAARVLQLVNSAMFGLPREVTSVAEAVTCIGFAAVRDLVLVLEVFSDLEGVASLPTVDLDALQRRAQQRAAVARAVAPRADADLAYTVALLRDLGTMVLVARAAERYIAVCYLQTTGLSVAESETEVFGVPGHLLAGALLESWQLPPPVVDGVRNPPASGELGVARLVEIADMIVDEASQRADDEPMLTVTRDMLAPFGTAHRLEVARELARTLMSGQGIPPVRDAA